MGAKRIQKRLRAKKSRDIVREKVSGEGRRGKKSGTENQYRFRRGGRRVRL